MPKILSLSIVLSIVCFLGFSIETQAAVQLARGAQSGSKAMRQAPALSKIPQQAKQLKQVAPNNLGQAHGVFQRTKMTIREGMSKGKEALGQVKRFKSLGQKGNARLQQVRQYTSKLKQKGQRQVTHIKEKLKAFKQTTRAKASNTYQRIRYGKKAVSSGTPPGTSGLKVPSFSPAQSTASVTTTGSTAAMTARPSTSSVPVFQPAHLRASSDVASVGTITSSVPTTAIHPGTLTPATYIAPANKVTSSVPSAPARLDDAIRSVSTPFQ